MWVSGGIMVARGVVEVVLWFGGVLTGFHTAYATDMCSQH